MRAALLCTAVLFIACSSAENDGMAEDTTSTAMGPAALTAADVEGSWDLEVRRMDSDSVILTGTMTMAPGSNVFTQIIGEGEARTVALTFDGDSMMTSVEPYASDVREGMMVATTGVYRMIDGQLEGITTARYVGDTSADSVIQYRGTMRRR